MQWFTSWWCKRLIGFTRSRRAGQHSNYHCTHTLKLSGNIRRHWRWQTWHCHSWAYGITAPVAGRVASQCRIEWSWLYNNQRNSCAGCCRSNLTAACVHNTAKVYHSQFQVNSIGLLSSGMRQGCCSRDIRCRVTVVFGATRALQIPRLNNDWCYIAFYATNHSHVSLFSEFSERRKKVDDHHYHSVQQTVF